MVQCKGLGEDSQVGPESRPALEIPEPFSNTRPEEFSVCTFYFDATVLYPLWGFFTQSSVLLYLMFLIYYCYYYLVLVIEFK